MHIDSGNMILLRKVQSLDAVKTPETFTERELTRALRDALIDEQNAIIKYEAIVDASTDDKVKKVVQDIADEERVHVGELMQLLSEITGKEEDAFLADGREEAEKA